MSALVDRALETSGLFDVLHARRAGDFRALQAAEDRLRAADLLALGALADRIRRDEVGDDVRIYLAGDASPESAPDVVNIASRSEGLAFLRMVAIARITGPRAARVRIDWSVVGLELAQVALGFGASEMTGALSSKRGLPLADDKLLGVGKRSQLEPALVVKRRELAALIERSGRRAVFAGAHAEASIGDHA
jgi:2-iminoacetate synthase ThiH